MTTILFCIAFAMASFFMYAVRGGSINIGNKLVGRALFGLIVATGFSYLAPAAFMLGGITIPSYLLSLWIIPMVWLSLITVGHSAYQGIWMQNPKNSNSEGKEHEWVGAFLPHYTEGQTKRNNFIAACGNFLVECFRGSMVFVPALLISPIYAVLPVFLGVGRALSYHYGEYLQRWGVLPAQLVAYTKEDGSIGIENPSYGAWKEMLNGLSWAVSTILASLLVKISV